MNSKPSFNKNKFLKDSATLCETKVSKNQKISHDTIKLTLDLPNINSELGLPLGKIYKYF